jgi:integrase
VCVALHRFIHEVYPCVTSRRSNTVRAALDQLLVLTPGASLVIFDQLKAEPSDHDVRHLQREATIPPRQYLPALLKAEELLALYDRVWHARYAAPMVMLKLLLFTGIRNVELAYLSCGDVYVTSCRVRIEQGKESKDRWVLFPLLNLARYCQAKTPVTQWTCEGEEPSQVSGIGAV